MIGDNYMVDFSLWSQTDGLKHGRTNLVVICLLHAKSGVNQSTGGTVLYTFNAMNSKIKLASPTS